MSESTELTPDVTVDATGQKCPMPVLLASRAAKELASGQLLLVQATDSGSRSDIPSWADATGNTLLEHAFDDGVYRYLIRKG